MQTKELCGILLMLIFESLDAINRANFVIDFILINLIGKENK